MLAVTAPAVAFHFVATYFAGQIKKLEETKKHLDDEDDSYFEVKTVLDIDQVALICISLDLLNKTLRALAQSIFSILDEKMINLLWQNSKEKLLIIYNS